LLNIQLKKQLLSKVKVNPSKSSGPDNIPNRILKECAVQLAPILQKIFKVSIDTGDLPKDWRDGPSCFMIIGLILFLYCIFVDGKVVSVVWVNTDMNCWRRRFAFPLLSLISCVPFISGAIPQESWRFATLPSTKIQCKNKIKPIMIKQEGLDKLLSKVNPSKSSGPDNIPNIILKECAVQLAPILQKHLPSIKEKICLSFAITD
jgi:hypothetical protein